MTDPVLGRRVALLRRVAEPVAEEATANVDAIVLSHLHLDHADVPSLRRAGQETPIAAPPAAAAWLRRRGFANVQATVAGEVVEVGGVRVEATPARHDGRRWPVGAPTAAAGFLIGSEPAVYFAGDTDLFAAMTELAGRVDVALLPVWGWGPKLGPGHLDPERAAEAAALIKPRVAIPIHWGTLARPIGGPTRAELIYPPHAFMTAAARVAPDVEVRILEPGDTTELEPPEGRHGSR